MAMAPHSCCNASKSSFEIDTDDSGAVLSVHSECDHVLGCVHARVDHQELRHLWVVLAAAPLIEGDTETVHISPSVALVTCAHGVLFAIGSSTFTLYCSLDADQVFDTAQALAEVVSK